jgi:hypothetical protein
MPAKRIDNVHRPLVALMLAHGATFQSTAAVGNGCPDGVVGFFSVDAWVEFKTPGHSTKKATAERQAAWRQRWKGSPCWVLRCPADVVRMLEDMRGRARKLGGGE